MTGNMDKNIMKKILFMIHDLSVGGAEKVLVNLVNNMNPEQFQITVIALFGGGVNEQFLKKNIRYQAVFKKTFPGNSKLMKLFTPRTLHAWFVKDKYDIEVSYLEGPTARIISGCPDADTKLVSWIHVEQHTQAVAAGAFRSYRESQGCYEKFDKIICVSEYVKNDFKEIYPSLKQLEVLYNTNETEMIRTQKDEPVEEQLFQADEIKLIGVGKIVPVKGFDKLARIHKRLKSESYPVHTYVLGVGDEQSKIEQYLSDNHISDSFTFLGYQTNPYQYVDKCDLFVCASIAEGFSTAATEALIVGTPVITTEVSGMKEMLGVNNEYGIVTENNEEALYAGIKHLLDHPGLLQHYKEMARERGNFFSKENTVQAVEEMLTHL
jgi:glycosyltransferase involved in cell wall biosynthesis